MALGRPGALAEAVLELVEDEPDAVEPPEEEEGEAPPLHAAAKTDSVARAAHRRCPR
jgi:hypothetical protein